MTNREKMEQTVQKIKDVMGDQFKISVSNGCLGGDNSWCFQFCEANPLYNIVHNSKVFMQIWIHDIPRCNSTGKYSFECGNSRLFRKINAKTLDSLLDKLVAYFSKNKEQFIELISKGKN